MYLSDELAQQARAAGLNISQLTQEAIGRTLAVHETDRWLDDLEQTPRSDVAHEQVMTALDGAREDLGT